MTAQQTAIWNNSALSESTLLHKSPTPSPQTISTEDSQQYISPLIE